MEILKEVCCLPAHNDCAWCVAWCPKGTLLASCGSDRLIKIWGKEGNNWVCKDTLKDIHTRSVRSVSWSPCGMYLASASFDGSAGIWSRKEGNFECMATLVGHENEVKAVSWARSGDLLATCSRDKSVWIWLMEDEQSINCESVQLVHTQDVKRVKWHPELNILASCGYDDTIRLFKDDMDDWTCFATLKSHTSTVWSLAFDKTGSRIASCSADKTVKIWQEYLPGNPEGVATKDKDPTWKCVCTLGGFTSRPIYDVDWSHVTGYIATAGGDDTIRVFREDDVSKKNEPSFSVVASVRKAHSQDVNSVAWNPGEGGLLASCSDDGTVKIWSLEKTED